MNAKQVESAIADVRAKTATVTSRFGTGVDLVIAASPWRAMTTDTSGVAVSEAKGRLCPRRSPTRPSYEEGGSK